MGCEQRSETGRESMCGRPRSRMENLDSTLQEIASLARVNVLSSCFGMEDYSRTGEGSEILVTIGK